MEYEELFGTKPENEDESKEEWTEDQIEFLKKLFDMETEKLSENEKEADAEVKAEERNRIIAKHNASCNPDKTASQEYRIRILGLLSYIIAAITGFFLFQIFFSSFGEEDTNYESLFNLMRILVILFLPSLIFSIYYRKKRVFPPFCSFYLIVPKEDDEYRQSTFQRWKREKTEKWGTYKFDPGRIPDISYYGKTISIVPAKHEKYLFGIKINEKKADYSPFDLSYLGLPLESESDKMFLGYVPENANKAIQIWWKYARRYEWNIIEREGNFFFELILW
mgnify:CR=1 FL=1